MKFFYALALTVIGSFATFSPAQAQNVPGDVHNCNTGCTVLTCDATTCRVYYCSSTGCVLQQTYPKPKTIEN